MADIELVIKIDEGTYRNIQSYDWKNGEWWYSEEWRAIHNGTPLPKGHGRLIDTDDIDNHIIGHVDTRSCPTIIEADRDDK